MLIRVCKVVVKKRRPDEEFDGTVVENTTETITLEVSERSERAFWKTRDN